MFKNSMFFMFLERIFNNFLIFHSRIFGWRWRWTEMCHGERTLQQLWFWMWRRNLRSPLPKTSYVSSSLQTRLLLWSWIHSSWRKHPRHWSTTLYASQHVPLKLYSMLHNLHLFPTFSDDFFGFLINKKMFKKFDTSSLL